MTVIVMTNARPSLRGELTRWMLEPKAGVFVGRITPVVRGRLWTKVRHSIGREASAIMLYAADTEQGYRVELIGEGDRTMRDFEGLWLVSRVRDAPES
jgi:CRISPR-associated protein Cas2